MQARGGFGYFCEPLFVAAGLLYAANTLWWKPATSDATSFVHCYLGDVLCMPVIVPVTLWLQQRLGLRPRELRPGRRELLLHWLLWSMCFEWLGPRLPVLAPGAVADPWDAVAYGAGGLLAAFAWGSRTGARVEEVVPGSVPSGGALLGRLAVAVGVALAVLLAYRVGAVVRLDCSRW